MKVALPVGASNSFHSVLEECATQFDQRDHLSCPAMNASDHCLWKGRNVIWSVHTSMGDDVIDHYLSTDSTLILSDHVKRCECQAQKLYFLT